ncbi:MAG: NAD(+) synthase [Clostridia bacterium]|nr:NAD(+) synthase [Clostridia bacterium]
MNHGFVRAAAAVPQLKVAECEYNSDNIIHLINKAENQGIQFVVFPELSITAYTCGDLFHQQALLKEAEKQLERILESTRKTEIVALIGLPVSVDNQLFNCAVAIQKGTILGVVPKTYIPGYSEFYEERWFASANRAVSQEIRLCGQLCPFGADVIFEAKDGSICFGVEICEDLWVPIPPSAYQSLAGAVLLFNLSASNDIIGKYEYRRDMLRQQSAKCIAGYVYASAGICESTTDVVFGGHSLIAEYGSILKETERFTQEEQLIFCEIDIEKLKNDRMKNTSFMEGVHNKKFRKVGFDLKNVKIEKLERAYDPHPFVPSNPQTRDSRCREIFAIQTAGLAKRMRHTGMKYGVIGISGGLDSTLALLVMEKTFDILGIPRENIIAVTMPGFGTTDITYTNAIQLMKSIGATIREVDIKPACLQHFKDIGHDADIHDVTYENVQARERTQVLMDVANKIGGLVIGTGDLSELALGWCTYNGDHMSMYAVNCAIPKTLVKFLVQWVADNIVEADTKDVLYRILDTPISPELLPPSKDGEIKQKTEDIIGPYELHDFFLYHMVRYGAAPEKILFLAKQVFHGEYEEETIKKWLKVFIRRFFGQQFKRSCLPDGPKVGTISLSPRGDWRMPSDAESRSWLKQLE